MNEIGILIFQTSKRNRKWFENQEFEKLRVVSGPGLKSNPIKVNKFWFE